MPQPIARPPHREPNPTATHLNPMAARPNPTTARPNPTESLRLTVKLLLMFLVLVSATLASDRSTSSKIRDCGNKAGLSTAANPNPAQRGLRTPPAHLSILGIIERPASQLEVSPLPPLEGARLFQQQPLLHTLLWEHGDISSQDPHQVIWDGNKDHGDRRMHGDDEGTLENPDGDGYGGAGGLGW